jgi:hypothetical protein
MSDLKNRLKEIKERYPADEIHPKFPPVAAQDILWLITKIEEALEVIKFYDGPLGLPAREYLQGLEK